MDRSLQIDNIQSFIKVTGNNITPWRLLLGRDVIHVDGRRGKVFLINPVGLQIGLELTTKKINNFKCQENFTREIYSTKDFDRIYPPLLYEEITELIQIKKEEIVPKKQRKQNIDQARKEKPIIKSSNLQINNIQSFVQTIGDNYYLWELLVGRKIRHFLKKERGRVLAWNPKTLEICVDFSFQTARFKYKEIVDYKQDRFIKEFSEIFPPLNYGEILIAIEKQQKAKKAQIEIIVTEKWEFEKQEAERIKAEKQDIERKKAQISEAEKQRQRVEKRKAEKQALLKNIQENFQLNFLNADNFYQSKCTEHISLNEYKAEKSNYMQSWLKQHLNSTADLEQATAIGAVEGHIQVVARAGSGKTFTLVNRALFLQKHCGVAPEQILLLAFNREAAREIQERLTTKLGNSTPHIMTFHALAYALVHPEESILFDEPNGGQSKSLAVQDNIINQYIRNKALDPAFYEEIRALMMAHFREDWERIVLSENKKSSKNTQILRYIRLLPYEGLDGRHYKSFGEKTIANFLLEHGIPYKYERNFWWNEINYRPDFTIGEKEGVVIEYFGLEGNYEYDIMSEQKRDYWRNNKNWYLLEFFPKDFGHGEKDFCSLLKQSLEDKGIVCNRLSEEEIWQSIKDNTINRFTKVIVQFIQRCRKLSLNPAELIYKINCYDFISDVEQQFLKVAIKFYQSYLEYLEATGKDDFDGLMQKAAEVVTSGKTLFHRKLGAGNFKDLRYVLIDEYQDFSELFYCLIKAVRQQNPHASFFCVGDDWQAINGFAGSDLKFYQNFEQFFQPSVKINMSTNYRSASSIVKIGNTLMQGLGVPACANKSNAGKVKIVELGTFKPIHKEKEEHHGDILTPAILRLVNKIIKQDKEIVLLSRKNSLPWYVSYPKTKKYSKNGTLDSFLELLRSHLPEDLRNKLTISTTHKYKGLEKKVVIVLDAVARCYPLLHPDLMFTRIFGDTIERVVEEERRLFYVAITRAVEHLFIITETNNISPFLEDLQKSKIISTLDWINYPPLAEPTKHIIVQIGNQDGQCSNPTYTIKNLLKDEGYCFGKNAWHRAYPAQGFSVQELFSSARWLSRANKIEVRFYDDLENILAVYRVNKGQFICVTDNIPKL